MSGAGVRSKYGNRRTEYQGQTYDSAAEARRAQELDLQQAAGVIRRWERGRDHIVWGHNGEVIRYRPDFQVYGADGSLWFEDVKGVETEAFRMKAKMFRALGYELRVIPA